MFSNYISLPYVNVKMKSYPTKASNLMTYIRETMETPVNGGSNSGSNKEEVSSSSGR